MAQESQIKGKLKLFVLMIRNQNNLERVFLKTAIHKSMYNVTILIFYQFTLETLMIYSLEKYVGVLKILEIFVDNRNFDV